MILILRDINLLDTVYHKKGFEEVTFRQYLLPSSGLPHNAVINLGLLRISPTAC